MSKLLIYDVKFYNTLLTNQEMIDVYNGVDFELKYKREKIKKERKEKIERLNNVHLQK